MKHKNSRSSLGKMLEGVILSTPKSLWVIFGITLLAFSNIFGNGFVMDDFSFIVEWSLIQELWNFPRFFFGYIPPEAQIGIYSPLRTLLFALNFDLWKFNPTGYHVFSLLVHFAGIYFIHRITLVLVRNRSVSFLTALLFALHPVHVEAITYITASVDTVGIVFLFAAFYYFLKAGNYQGALAVPGGNYCLAQQELPPQEAARGPDIRKIDYGISVCLAALAIFTHELALMLPFLFLFYDAYFRGRGSKPRELFSRHWPFFVIAFLYILLKATVLGAIGRGHHLFDQHFLSLWVVIKVMMKYLGVVFFPVVLTHNPVISTGIYSFGEKDFTPQAVWAQSLFDEQILLSLLLLIGIGVIALKCYRRQPIISFCIGWFFICLLPVSQIIPSSVFYGERYLYPSSWSVCLLLSVMIDRLCSGRWAGDVKINGARQQGAFPGVRSLGVTMLVLLVLFYFARTYRRNRDWHSEITFYQAAVKANPQSAGLRNDLGVVYMEYELFDKAISSIQQAIAMNPQEAHYHFTLGEAYFRNGDEKKAIQSLNRVIAINPDFAEGYYNLASAYGALGEEQTAQVYLDKAIAAYKKQGRILEAGEYARMLLKSLADRNKEKKAKTVNP